MLSPEETDAEIAVAVPGGTEVLFRTNALGEIHEAVGYAPPARGAMVVRIGGQLAFQNRSSGGRAIDGGLPPCGLPDRRHIQRMVMAAVGDNNGVPRQRVQVRRFRHAADDAIVGFNDGRAVPAEAPPAAHGLDAVLESIRYMEVGPRTIGIDQQVGGAVRNPQAGAAGELPPAEPCRV